MNRILGYKNSKLFCGGNINLWPSSNADFNIVPKCVFGSLYFFLSTYLTCITCEAPSSETLSI